MQTEIYDSYCCPLLVNWEDVDIRGNPASKGDTPEQTNTVGHLSTAVMGGLGLATNLHWRKANPVQCWIFMMEEVYQEMQATGYSAVTL